MLKIFQKPSRTLLPSLPLIHSRNVGRKAKKGEIDPRKEQMKYILYPPNRIQQKSSSPIGAYRHTARLALRRIITNRTVHETIERAYLLHRRHIRKSREEETSRKFNSMKVAMEQLERHYPHLAREANKKLDPNQRNEEEAKMAGRLKGFARRAMDARVPGFFPREMRPPVDTPRIGGWDHEWKPAAVRGGGVVGGVRK